MLAAVHEMDWARVCPDGLKQKDQSAIDNYLNHHFRQNGFSPCV